MPGTSELDGTSACRDSTSRLGDDEVDISGSRMEINYSRAGPFARKQPVGQISVQPGFEKYFASPFARNSFMDSNRPTPQEGRWPSSRTRGGMRWTRQCQARNVMQGGFDEDP
jgi:hypothetical protein